MTKPITERLEGPVLHRSLPATLTLRELPEDTAAGEEAAGLMRLHLSVSSEIPYLRASFFDEPWVEVLGHNPDEVDLTRFETGAAVFANHGQNEPVGKTPLRSIGAIESAALVNQRMEVDILISRREALDDLRQDIQDGLVRNVSVGYRIHERILTLTNPNGPNEYRVTRWEPYEVSLVDVPADGTVGLGRAEEPAAPGEHYRILSTPPHTRGTEMNEDQNTAAPAAIPPPSAPAPGQPQAASVQAVREAVRAAGFPPETALDLVERALPIDEVRAELFRQMAVKSDAGAPTQGVAVGVQILRDQVDNRRDLMVSAMQHRLDPKSRLLEGAGDYRYMGLRRMAEEVLTAEGHRVRSMSPMEIASRALHTASDFPNLLSAVANKRLATAYAEAVGTYTRWARRAPNAPDFKAINIIQLGGAPDLEELKEGGELRYGTIGEGAETYSVITYAKGISLSRKALINDDLRGFDRLVTAFAAASARKENALVYAQLTSNPTMGDGVALFHSTHGNLAGTGAEIAVATLSAGRAAMRTQTGLAGEVLNISPAFLLAPAAQESEAYLYTSANFVPVTAATQNEFRAGGRTALDPIVDAILDASSTTAWYLLGDGVGCDTVEYCYLDGSEGVYIESGMDFDVDGLKLKARLDFGAKAADHRGVYKNGGA